MNHRRVLGWLFAVWAALQAIAALYVLSVARDVAAMGALALVVAAIFGWGAWRLLKTQQPAWVLGLGLSIAALFSFPLGTVIGIFGLWIAFARPESLGGAPRFPWRRKQQHV